jgi:hypothetical protein
MNTIATWATYHQEVIHSTPGKSDIDTITNISVPQTMDDSPSLHTKTANQQNTIITENPPNTGQIIDKLQAKQESPKFQVDDPQGEDHSHLIQQVLTPTKTNLPFGNLITETKDKHTFRIFYQNVNSIFKFKSWNTLEQATKEMKINSVDIIGFAETNIKWDVRKTNAVKNIFQRQYKVCSIATSSHQEKCRTEYQPGGTLTAITSKYTGKVLKTIHDASGMGRWSGFTMATTTTSTSSQHINRFSPMVYTRPTNNNRTLYSRMEIQMRIRGRYYWKTSPT